MPMVRVRTRNSSTEARMGRTRGTVEERRPGVWRLRGEGSARPDYRPAPAPHSHRLRDGEATGAAGVSKAPHRDDGETAAGEHPSQTVADACDSWLTVFDTLAAAGRKSPASAKCFR